MNPLGRLFGEGGGLLRRSYWDTPGKEYVRVRMNEDHRFKGETGTIHFPDGEARMVYWPYDRGKKDPLFTVRLDEVDDTNDEYWLAHYEDFTIIGECDAP